MTSRSLLASVMGPLLLPYVVSLLSQLDRTKAGDMAEISGAVVVDENAESLNVGAGASGLVKGIWLPKLAYAAFKMCMVLEGAGGETRWMLLVFACGGFHPVMDSDSTLRCETGLEGTGDSEGLVADDTVMVVLLLLFRECVCNCNNSDSESVIEMFRRRRMAVLL